MCVRAFLSQCIREQFPVQLCGDPHRRARALWVPVSVMWPSCLDRGVFPQGLDLLSRASAYGSSLGALSFTLLFVSFLKCVCVYDFNPIGAYHSLAT